MKTMNLTKTELKLSVKKAESAMPLYVIFKNYDGTFEMNTVLGVRTYKTLEAAQQMKQYCEELEQCSKEEGF